MTDLVTAKPRPTPMYGRKFRYLCVWGDRSNWEFHFWEASEWSEDWERRCSEHPE